jgi:glycosyltransferase involved in cell wall biosynthesis
MRKIRIGIFGRDTAPADGGADTLLTMLASQILASADDATIELVPVPAAASSHRRQPGRTLRRKLASWLGREIAPVDLRPVCRQLRLDLAYFAVPIFAEIDVPYIFTLWDAGHRTIPEFPEVRTAGDSWAQREALCRTMLPRASYVVVGNRTGAEELAAFFGLDRARVVAIPFPNPDFGNVPAVVPAWRPSRPYFLYPAQAWPHKNHHTLLRALALLRSQGGPEADLVFVGSDKGNLAYLKSTAAALNLGDRVHFGGFVSRGELKALYQGAAALTFASLLGPNNLPPQEAAVLDCPTILSDLPGHREQMGDGALYVSPLDAVAWAAAMRRILSDAPLRADLVTRARRAVAGCTLTAYAGQLNRLFSELAARRLLWGDRGAGE